MKSSELKALSEGVNDNVLKIIDLKIESDMEKILLKMDAQIEAHAAKMDAISRQTKIEMEAISRESKIEMGAIEKRFEDKANNMKWTISIVVGAVGLMISIAIIVSRLL